ncbi:hypothetical protein [Agromyces bracchium]|uniref:Protein TPRXL n=1 Tax=Agromyces bracchium TaxID=88376 RepID=A0A6I3M8V8_9MICO|nr:hypothetical protein [Agromyces bracchium]MTH69734.1 hypothetical protein [Agromyces bracchium]
MSLREQLTGSTRTPVPPFVLLLPPGWVSVEATREAFDELLGTVSERMRAEHRPDLDARFRALVRRASDEFLRRDPVRLVYQRSVPAERMLPLAITAARVAAPGGATLDAQVAELVRTRGAAPLDDARVVMRWSSDSSHRIDGGTLRTRSFDYLVAIPGTGRREALVFTAVVPLAAGGERLDDDAAEEFGLLADAILSTFRWSGA